MPDRIQCCVPFCRRTKKKDEHAEWICGDHWRAVSPALRADYNAMKRKARRIIARKPLYMEWWKYPGGSSNRLAALAMWRRLGAAWDSCKAAAIEAAAGI